MNFGELKNEVEVVLQDTSFVDRIPDWINDAVDLAIDAADVPGFKTILSIDTVVDQAYTNLPDSFSGRILYAGDSKGELSGGIVDLTELMKMYPSMNKEGDVEYISIEGALLYYQPIPSRATSLTILCRRKPTRMALAGDIPEGIPEHLHRSVIVPRAAVIGFDMIEDGVEGNKVNTAAQMRLYNIALYDLKCWVAKRAVHRTRSIWRY